MKKMLLLAVVTLLALGLSASTRAYQRAEQTADTQGPIKGDWTAKVRDTERGRKLWLSLTTEKTGQQQNWSQMSFDLPLQDFSGLDPNANSSVRFGLNREAGAATFEGLFRDGRGVGDFLFTPNLNFASSLKQMGYEEPDSRKLFSMTIHDVGTRFMAEMKQLDYDKVSLDKLISFRIFDVNAEFIQRMKALGYDNIPADKLTALKIHGVTEEFIKEFQALSQTKLPLDKLIAFRIHG